MVSPEKLGEYRARVEANPADMEAWFWIGTCYYHNQGGVEVYDGLEEAEMIWRRALRQLGRDENVNDGTGKIRFRLRLYDEAVPRLQLEADLGDNTSQRFLAFCYLNRFGGLERDTVKMAFWFERSAELGNVDSQVQTGLCYVHGNGVEQDLVKAVEWFDRAIAQKCQYELHGSATQKECLIYSLNATDRDRVLGCVQRNIWLRNIKESIESGPQMAVWVLALQYLAGSRNEWARHSPFFLCLKEVIPILPESGKKRTYHSE